MIGHQPQDNEWELNLPNLEEFHMENHEPPVENFARAMVNSPQIQRFYAHKYWHNDKLPGLYLPNCSRFIFRRGDRTLGLRVYLPKVQELTLDGCYGLDSFEFILEGHPAHAEWNHTSGRLLTQFSIFLHYIYTSSGELILVLFMRLVYCETWCYLFYQVKCQKSKGFPITF